MIALPNVLGPILPKGDTLDGIFSEIKKKYSSDPIEDGIVSLNATTSKGNLNYIIQWDGDWASEIGSNYLEIYFPNHFLFPSYYSLKSPKSDFYYQKEWIVYGFTDDTKSDKKQWSKIHEGISSENVFCGTETTCNGEKTNTFQMNTFFPPKGFKYIRFETTVGSNENVHFVSSGIDFYGFLTTENKLPISFLFKCTSSFSLKIIQFYLITSTALLIKF